MKYEAMTEYGSVTAWLEGDVLVYEWRRREYKDVERFTLPDGDSRPVAEHMARDWHLLAAPIYVGVA